MPADWVKLIGAYFDAAAPEYAASVEPAFAPLAAALVKYADLQPTEAVLDLGTGTGAAAREAVSTGALVLGVDISHKMLVSARQLGLLRVAQADMHELPLKGNIFDAVLAAFALNSSDPELALREALRVMRPGARIVIHEWDTADPISELVNETFAEYIVDDPPAEVAEFRSRMEQPIPWDELGSIEALASLLEKIGYEAVELSSVTIPVHLQSIDAFLRYKLAWPVRAAELAIMPPDVYTLCLHDLRENLAPYADSLGRIIWTPNLVRIRAWKNAHDS